MCCFHLDFSDFNVLFFQKIEILLQFTLEKNNLLCKKREKITCHEKNPSPLNIKWSVPNQTTDHIYLVKLLVLKQVNPIFTG